MTQTILKELERAEGFYRVKEKEIPRWTIAWYNSENKAWVVPYQTSPKKDQDFDEINENIIDANPAEELEVPVAGVTDEEIMEKFIKSIPDFPYTPNHVYEARILKFGLKCFKAGEQLSVTGNKPLKTEDLAKAVAYGLGYITGKHNLNLDHEYVKKISWDYANKNSTPIDTLDKELFDPQICSICKINIDAIPTVAVDKEALLKQAKNNPTPEEFLEDKYAIYREGGKFDVSPQEIYKWMEEYLRLCTGGGEK